MGVDRIREHRHEIGYPWIDAELREHRCDLTTMMDLMIEEVGYGNAERYVPIAAVGHRMIAHVTE